jgi:hypothetical protein
MVLEITSKHFWLKIDDMEGESRLFVLPAYAQKRDLFSSPFTHLLLFWRAWQSAFRLYYTLMRNSS